MFLVLLSAVPAQAGPIFPTFPTLPPLPIAPINELAAAVQHPLDDDRFQGTGFGSASAFADEFQDIYNPLTDETVTWRIGGGASITSSGGMLPMLRSEGELFGFSNVSANGRFTYAFMVQPLNPLIQAPGGIPVVVTPNGGGTISPGGGADGAINVSVDVSGIPNSFFHLQMSDGSITQQINTFGLTYTTVYLPSELNGVTMRVSSGAHDRNTPNGSTSFSAFADPIIHVDPDATFEHNGQTLKYVDHYGIAYSEGIEQWQQSAAVVPEPSSLVLLGMGFCGIAGLSRKRWRSQRSVSA